MGWITLFSATVWTAAILAQEIKVPNAKDAFRFVVIGDTGTGGSDEYKVAQEMVAVRKLARFDIVTMMGDNMYGGEAPKDFIDKFEKPYEALLKDNVKFYASLGNHDNSNQRFYKNFNMEGKRYYSIKPHDGIRFFALDSNYMDKEQVEWLDKELGGPDNDWRIVFFHHPLYSTGEAHGSSTELRNILEPIFLKHNVSLVLAGHEHFYERIVPQHGIPYFIVGSSAKLRKGNIAKTPLMAKGFDTDNVFMLCEIDKDTLTYKVISKTGATIDTGTIQRPTTQVAPAK